jgi:hypothetical protein
MLRPVVEIRVGDRQGGTDGTTSTLSVQNSNTSNRVSSSVGPQDAPAGT